MTFTRSSLKLEVGVGAVSEECIPLIWEFLFPSSFLRTPTVSGYGGVLDSFKTESQNEHTLFSTMHYMVTSVQSPLPLKMITPERRDGGKEKSKKGITNSLRVL